MAKRKYRNTINKVKHIYHISDENVLLEHTTIMKKFNNSYLFNSFINFSKSP